jgi:hypothetical protein
MFRYRYKAEIMLSVRSIQKKLEKKSRSQKLFITMMIVAGCLLFYAIGIATNFFGQPIFSMFFIISEETAHNLVVYIAFGAAFALGTLALVLTFAKKRKSSSLEVKNKTDIPQVQRPFKAVTSSNVKTLGKPEVTTSERKMKHLTATQLAEDLRAETVKAPISQQKPKLKVTQTINKDKLTCHSCKKVFSTPMLMLEYPNSVAKLVSYCPYCLQPL